MIAEKLEQELQKKGAVLVNETSCDGCGACIEVCPQEAIEFIILTKEQVRKLSFKGRLKVRFKGNSKVFISQELCNACGLCMKQCHEFAIRKVKN